jgi:hypothetical protein
MSAVTDGQNIQKPAATRVFIRYSSQRRALPASARKATTRIISPREPSRTITRWRRSSRSITTPVKGSISRAGIVCRMITVPSAISECVACRMYQTTAAEFMPLPSIEIKLATKMRRKPRCRKIASMESA